MEQRSNVQNRAEKLYKNSREKFYFLLREILSNSIQAVLIRKGKEICKKEYAPEVSLEVNFTDKECTIKLKDNGEGFTSNNTICFDELDKRNEEKEKNHFHPLGQGRLAIIYFADSAIYETVYRDAKGELKSKKFPYPKQEEGLFSLIDFEEDVTDAKDTYTLLKIEINKQQTYGRANTFFKKYNDATSLKKWMIETFFPFIVSNDDLTINIDYNGTPATISLKSIEVEIDNEPFKLAPYGDKNYDFKLWLIKSGERLTGDNSIACFARYLKAELLSGKLTYTIDSQEGYLLYLTSDLFDEYVDTKGESIEISIEAVTAINEKINELLDVKFKETIEKNRKENKRSLKVFKKQFPSLDAFIPEDAFADSKRIIEEEDLVKTAIDTKGKYEKRFWNKMSKPDNDIDDVPYDESEECQKLLNSSLHIYVKHRERVLERLHEMIKPNDEDGEPKPELESDVQELLFKRGNLIDHSRGINHLHNLWILDDKFTTFSSTLKGESTKPGQEKADVYIWSDNPEAAKQVLILELKSTTHAHNAGSSKEGMIAQVKRYAKNVYNNPEGTLNWDTNTDNIQYNGIILARKKDILKEITSNNAGGFKRIPFLVDSRYKDDEFYPKDNSDKAIPIRIELYSFEEIYGLASSRNEVFFRLLKNEFGVEENSSAQE